MMAMDGWIHLHLPALFVITCAQGLIPSKVPSFHWRFLLSFPTLESSNLPQQQLQGSALPTPPTQHHQPPRRLSLEPHSVPPLTRPSAHFSTRLNVTRY